MTPPPAIPAGNAVLYEPGYVIAEKYELESMLGEGGMGAVWRARNLALDSSVAIKVVRAGADRAALRSRLLQEARAAAKLAHPAIVKAFDVGQTESGDPFIVMELLTGSSLGAILASEGSLPGVQAVRILLPIVDALWLAHGKGIVHRDIKPDNVFIVQHEGVVQPKLVDFGIVKVQAADGGSQLTQGGVVLGSPDYMSPEQARGLDDVDLRSDVWSLCVVLYEAIAGKTPFEGNNYNALLRDIVESTPRTLQEVSATDAELSAIVERGLRKDREQRFASMGELGRALAAWLVARGVHEDICGTTIEPKWLRGMDLHERPGRTSMASLSDLWPAEGGSGVRPSSLRSVNTLPARTASDGPAPEAQPKKRSVPGVVVVVAALALILGGVWRLTRQAAPPGAPVSPAIGNREGPPSAPRAAVAEPLAAPSLVPPAPVVADTAVTARPVASANIEPPLATGKKVSSPSSNPRGSANRAGTAAKTVPPIPSTPSPRGDLLSPY